MITARNYAAQAEQTCNKMQNILAKMNMPKDSEYCKMLALTIANSQHFAVPDEGFIFNDELKGLTNETWKLPFPVTTVEYFIPKTEKTPTYKKLIVAVQRPAGGIIINSVTFQNNTWIPLPGHITIPQKWWDTTHKDSELSDLSNLFKPSDLEGLLIATSRPVITMPVQFEQFIETYGKVEAEKVLTFSLVNEGRIVLELVEALTCRNVYTELLEKVNHKTNERRIKAGKLPFYETKILVLDSKQKTVDTTYYGGTHASPRQHLRRGHIRRLDSGNIWINNCVVGKASNGKIDKSYEVK